MNKNTYHLVDCEKNTDHTIVHNRKRGEKNIEKEREEEIPKTNTNLRK